MASFNVVALTVREICAFKVQKNRVFQSNLFRIGF